MDWRCGSIAPHLVDRHPIDLKSQPYARSRQGWIGVVDELRHTL